MIYLYPRALGWLVKDIRQPDTELQAVLWEMLPCGTLTAANDV